MALKSKIHYILLFFFSMGSTILSGQNLWNLTSPEKTSELPNEVIIEVSDYQLTSVDFGKLKKELSSAPEEFTGKYNETLHFPMPDGQLREYYVFNSPIMQEGLQEKFPEIQNYKIISVDKKSVGRIGVTYNGFHGSIMTENGRVYIDQYSDTSKEFYASYYTKNYQKTLDNIPACGVSSEDTEKYLENFDLENIEMESKKIKTKSPEGDAVLRTYRCAIGCTGEFGSTKGGTVEKVMSVINQSVTKINEIFESEVGIRMILVNDNDKLLYFDGTTDPYENPNMGGSLIGQNTAIITGKIGFDKYDIGHVYTNACSDVGGIASLASVCGSSKGNGVTCHYSSDVDLISVRVACHEMGHQFSAPHTFNFCDGENESSSTGYEPGSGHTIMSYAGGCGPERNVASAPYPYFHGNSVERMVNFSQTGNGDNCASYIETNNTNPIAGHDYVDGFSIPIETPFRLDGWAIDAENDPLTYSWEEFDIGPACLPGEPVLDAPQFVSEIPNETPERILPSMDKIISNIFDKREVLPFYDKDMTWRLTVRDNNIEAGASDFIEVQFYAVEEAGPFLVMYPNSTEEFIGGQSYTIEWDVANTDGATVNCQKVDVLLSVDGGLTYPYLLKSFTPNDGQETVVMPDVEAQFARIMVRASDNIFFDISNSNSQISPATIPGYTALAVPGFQEVCLPNSADIEINTLQFANFTEPITLEVISGLPAGATAEFSETTVNPGESTTLTIDGDNVFDSGEYELTIRGIAGLDTVLTYAIIELTSSDYSDLQTVSPAKGESAIPSAPTFEWVLDTDAESYIFELSDNPDFTNGEINIFEDNIIENTYSIDESLFKNEVYFWRVTGVNKCGKGFTTAISTFATEALSCASYKENAVPVNIPSSLATTTSLESVIVTSGKVSDVNIRKFRGTHNNFKELKATLVSPTGTEVLLFDNRCAGSTTFNGGFDSDSPTEIACPLSNGKLYKPEGDLSIFNGEDLQGTWTLNIEDKAAGNGGKVNEYTLEVCSNASLSAPSLIKNVPMKIGPNQQQLINQGRLLVEDENNDPDELEYTIVEAPEHGFLFTSVDTLGVGSTFTQYTLNNNYLLYKSYDESDPVADKFVFTVDDGEGGWIDLTTFNIEIDIMNSLDESDQFDYDVILFPNPARDIVNIKIGDVFTSDVNVEITDVLGRRLKSTNYENGISYIQENVTSLTSGTYFFKVTIADASKVFKVQLNK